MNTQEPIRVIIEKSPESLSDYLSNPNTIIAISAILVSIFGLIFSIIYSRKTIKITQNHNIKSVEPFINTTINLTNDNINYSIFNNGYGPAIIESIEFIIEGKKFTDLGLLYLDTTPNFMEHVDKQNQYSTQIKEDSVVRPSEEIVLFCSHFFNQKFYDELKLVSRKVEVIIKYKSIYNVRKVKKDTVI